MAQQVSKVFGNIGGVKFCKTAEELWAFVEYAFTDDRVDYVRISREEITPELPKDKQELEKKMREYREKY